MCISQVARFPGIGMALTICLFLVHFMQSVFTFSLAVNISHSWNKFPASWLFSLICCCYFTCHLGIVCLCFCFPNNFMAPSTVTSTVTIVVVIIARFVKVINTVFIAEFCGLVLLQSFMV